MDFPKAPQGKNRLKCYLYPIFIVFANKSSLNVAVCEKVIVSLRLLIEHFGDLQWRKHGKQNIKSGVRK